MELQQLIQLKRKGLSNRQIARDLGVSRNTVNGYVCAFKLHDYNYEQLETLSERELGCFPRKIPKTASDTSSWQSIFPPSVKELRKTGCTLQTLWRSYLEDHPDGYRYTQFVHHFNQ